MLLTINTDVLTEKHTQSVVLSPFFPKEGMHLDGRLETKSVNWRQLIIRDSFFLSFQLQESVWIG